jgi:glycosyltransferase involved in cell wall biosynthesis
MSPNTLEDGESPLTFAVCSNDPGRVSGHALHNFGQLGPHDRLLVVFDTEETPTISKVATKLRSKGVDVVFSGPERGLSFARNTALRTVASKYLVFIDDDVTVLNCAVEGIRAAFGAGSHVVGVRLEPGPHVDLSKWYISPSQFHYLGLHCDGLPGKTWGACMGFNLDFVNSHELRFRIELGRKGRSLISGDDTSFVSECVGLGAHQMFLDDIRICHHIASDRLRLSRMLSRAVWQGRSEVRRNNACRGALKEWQRNVFGWRQAPLRVLGLGALYQSMVMMGVAIEMMMSLNRASLNASAARQAPHASDTEEENVSPPRLRRKG